MARGRELRERFPGFVLVCETDTDAYAAAFKAAFPDERALVRPIPPTTKPKEAK